MIEVGNAPDDRAQYYHFFDMSAIDKNLLARPLYIHLDMSLSGDKTGIAGIWITGKQATTDMSTSRELFYKLAFSVSIKAPKGYQVSFEKNRNFIRWLREQGFVIKGISSDTFQSAQMQQQLKADGFEVSTISVDRLQTLDKVPGRAEDGSTPSRKVCIPYQYFKSTLYERRLTVYDKCDLLTDEVLGLEKQADGHIDHPEGGTMGCFTGETKVKLTDGRSLSFLELIEEQNKGIQNYVYSINKDKQTIEAKPIVKAWKTLENQPLVRITLDNDQIIECTLNHRFMLRNGEYIEARDLIPGESLMPLYTKMSSKGLKGYRLYYEPLEEEWHFEHRRFCKEILDEKYLVHHKNCDKLNNNPDNLIWVSKSKHQIIHAQLQTGAHSKEAEIKRSNSVAKFHRVNKKNKGYWIRYYPNLTPEEAYKAHLETVEKNKREKLDKQLRLKEKEEAHLKNQIKKENQLKKQKEMADYYGIDLTSLTPNELKSLMIKYTHEIDQTYTERVSRAVSENHKKGKYKNAYEALKKCNEHRKKYGRPKEAIEKMLATKATHGPYIISEETRKKWSENTSKRRWYNNGETNIYINPEEQCIPEGYVHGRIKTWKNHKVKNIKIFDCVEDVYDIEVKDNHNFALAAGVFVHNSKDQSDAICGALYNASQHAEEFAFEFGEDLSLAVEVSNTTNDENRIRQQITLDFEQELQRAFETQNQKEYRENLVARDTNYFKDFGNGKAQVLNPYYLSQGIIL